MRSTDARGRAWPAARHAACRLSAATGGFRLAYDRSGDGPPVLALHGWPGARVDYREVVPRLTGYDVVVPDLRGFSESDKHRSDPAAAYSAAAQAASVIALIEELLLTEVVIAGYDIGSRIGQVVAAARPGLLRALVVAPPLPGVGARVLDAAAQHEFWYRSFHQLDLAEQLVDGRPDAVRACLAHFWSHWSGLLSSWGTQRSIGWSSTTLRRARSSRLSAGNGLAQARSPARWPSRRPR